VVPEDAEQSLQHPPREFEAAEAARALSAMAAEAVAVVEVVERLLLLLAEARSFLEVLEGSLVSLRALVEQCLPWGEDVELDVVLPLVQACPLLPACQCRPLEVCLGFRLFRPRLSDSAAGGLDSRRCRVRQQA